MDEATPQEVPAAAAPEEQRVTIQPEIYAFAHLMQIRLEEERQTWGANGWRGLSPMILRTKLQIASGELRNAIQRKDFRAVEDKTADCALFAMMIFDDIWFYRDKLEEIGWRNGPIMPKAESDTHIDDLKRMFNRAEDKRP